MKFYDLEVKQELRPGDIFIFDRGFRDCLPYMEANDFVTKTLEFVLKTQPRQQLTTEQANRSRLVTKTRYVVEVQNGHLKTVWPIFAEMWPTIALKHRGEDLRNAAALLNAFFRQIVANKDKEAHVANAMLSKMNIPNIVHAVVQEFSHEDLDAFVLIDENDFAFPRIDEDDLPQITLGSY